MLQLFGPCWVEAKALNVASVTFSWKPPSDIWSVSPPGSFSGFITSTQICCDPSEPRAAVSQIWRNLSKSSRRRVLRKAQISASRRTSAGSSLGKQRDPVPHIVLLDWLWRIWCFWACKNITACSVLSRPKVFEVCLFLACRESPLRVSHWSRYRLSLVSVEVKRWWDTINAVFCLTAAVCLAVSHYKGTWKTQHV